MCTEPNSVVGEEGMEDEQIGSIQTCTTYLARAGPSRLPPPYPMLFREQLLPYQGTTSATVPFPQKDKMGDTSKFNTMCLNTGFTLENNLAVVSQGQFSICMIAKILKRFL